MHVEWMSENELGKLLFLFHHVCSRVQTQVTKFDSKHSHPLGHLVGKTQIPRLGLRRNVMSGEMAPWEGALDALPKDLGLITAPPGSSEPSVT